MGLGEDFQEYVRKKKAIQHFCKCFGWVLRKQGEYKRNLDILGFLEAYFTYFVTLTLRNSKRLQENKSYFLEIVHLGMIFVAIGIVGRCIMFIPVYM